MYGYVYKTTNLINGKIYVGQHKADKFDCTYFGSGKILLKAIEKYGISNFVCEVIEWCKTQSITNSRERYWIKYYNSTDRQFGYNITEGGEGWKGGHHTEESKQKISVSKSGKHPNRDYTQITSETKAKISATLKEYYKTHKNSKYGTHLSDETKAKLREANLGKTYSQEVRDKHKRQAWNKGVPMTEEAKEHLRQVNLGKVYPSSTRDKHRQRWLGKKNPNYGGISDSAKQKLREHNLGKIWVCNGVDAKQIKPENLQEYIEKGYHRGRNKFTQLKED